MNIPVLMYIYLFWYSYISFTSNIEEYLSNVILTGAESRWIETGKFEKKNGIIVRVHSK